MSAREDIEKEISAIQQTYAEYYQLWTQARTCINRLRSICPIDPQVKPVDILTGAEIDEAKTASVFADVQKEHADLKEKLNAIKQSK